MSDRPVLVLHEGWGRTPDIDHVVERLARSGLTAVAPNLFAGHPAWWAAPSSAALLPYGGGVAGERADMAYRDSQPSAILGFSLGAAIALRRTWPVPVVAAYGHVPRRIPAPGPILGIYGTADRPLRRSGLRLDAAEHSVVRWYDGAGHSFLASGAVPSAGRMLGPHPAADDAWEAITAFLVSATTVRS